MTITERLKVRFADDPYIIDLLSDTTTAALVNHPITNNLYSEERMTAHKEIDGAEVAKHDSREKVCRINGERRHSLNL